jgi:S1-C subfamily serine protease
VKQITNSIIVIDGHLKRIYGATDSIIIVRGDIIKAPPPVRYPDIEFYGLRNSIIICTGKYRPSDKCIETKSYLKDQVEQPLGFIKWFTIGEVGLEVSPAPSDGLQVDKLHDGKPARKAGLDLGDVIIAVDGMQIDGQESLRRRLMRGVVNERCTVTVKRGGKSLDVPLDFRAEERAKEKAKPPEKR